MWGNILNVVQVLVGPCLLVCTVFNQRSELNAAIRKCNWKVVNARFNIQEIARLRTILHEFSKGTIPYAGKRRENTSIYIGHRIVLLLEIQSNHVYPSICEDSYDRLRRH